MQLAVHRGRNIFLRSLMISVGCHIAVLTYFYFHPFILQAPVDSLLGMKAAIPTPIFEEEALDEEKNQFLEEAFKSLVILPSYLQEPYDRVKPPKSQGLAPKEEGFVAEMSVAEAVKIDAPQLFAALPKQVKIEPVSDHLLVVEAKELSPSPMLVTIDLNHTEPPLSILEPTSDEVLVLSNVGLQASLEEVLSHPVPTKLPPMCERSIQLTTSYTPPLVQEEVEDLLASDAAIMETEWISFEGATAEDVDFAETFASTVYTDDFDVDVTFIPNPEGSGYIFSLSLMPGMSLNENCLKQNFYFVIDRSSTVQKHRFSVFKRAVLKALNSMQATDTFNIFLMDKKIRRFTKTACAPIEKNIRAAEQFLDKQESGGFFASSDVYVMLEKLLPLMGDNEEAHTVILLTDGKTHLSKERKQKTLTEWVEKNRGKAAVYPCAVGRDNDLLTLDMLSSISGGRLLYSDTHASLPRKVAKLILDLKDPIATDLIVTASTADSDTHFELYPANPHQSSLYGHQPYVIVGQTDSLCDFDLIVQGRQRKSWVHLKKNLSLKQGEKGNAELTKLWKSRKAQGYYGQFLEQGRSAALKVAKEIMQKSRKEVAFE